MSPIEVAVFSAKPYDRAFLLRAAGERINFHCYELGLNPETAVMADGMPVVSAFVNDDLGKETLQKLAARNVKLIALRCAGTNQVDLKVAEDLGITVVNVPAYSPYAVAEHTIALMLALSRKIPRAYNRVRDGNFSLDGLLGFDFYQKAVGIVGGGKIGRLVGERMQAFGCDIYVYEPYQPQACVDMGFKVVSLDELLSVCDIVR